MEKSEAILLRAQVITEIKEVLNKLLATEIQKLLSALTACDEVKKHLSYGDDIAKMTGLDISIRTKIEAMKNVIIFLEREQFTEKKQLALTPLKK